MLLGGRESVRRGCSQVKRDAAVLLQVYFEDIMDGRVLFVRCGLISNIKRFPSREYHFWYMVQLLSYAVSAERARRGKMSNEIRFLRLKGVLYLQIQPYNGE